MKRREFLQTAGCIAAWNAGLRGLGAQIPSAPGGKQPNFVLILADDLGIGGLGCYGSDIFKTPHLDRLAAGGIRFTHCYTAPLAGPSRAMMMTGRYPFRTGATNQDASAELDPADETFIPAILKPAGYVTASIGSWGQLPLGPAEFSFDEHLKFAGSAIYWNTQDKGRTYLRNGAVTALRDKEYLPDVMHDFLVGFMARNRERPFYAYYSLPFVHPEIMRTPDTAADTRDLYSDNIAYLDKLVGKLVAELERLRLRDNTMIVFVSDGGTGGVFADESTIGGRRLSGEKGSLLEGGALVPLIVNWPGTTPAGKVSADLIDSSDFLPTLAELAGAKLPDDTVIDGRSFAPQLRGRTGKPRDSVFVQLAGKWYAREAGWKLNQAGKLFDMSKAPFEETIVAADSKDPAALAARRRLQAALDQLNPAGGILDDGDGTGRHASRQTTAKKKKKKNQSRKGGQ